MTRPASPFNLNYIERPFDPDRKRYYFVDDDTPKAGDCNILNWSKFTNENRGMGHGRQFKTIPAGQNILGNEVSYRHSYGLPKLPETIQLKVALKKKPIDCYKFGGDFYVSGRAKELFEALDPNAFAFTACITTTRRSLEIETYYMCAVNRVVPEFDEKKSIFINEGPEHSKLHSGRHTILSASKAFDIHMKPDMPLNYQAFWLIQFGGYPVFSEIIVDAWRAAKMKGLYFTPLQTPTKKEAKGAAHFLTWEYYFQGSRKYWQGKI
jgi:Protein of unknown function (DUF1629)